VVFPEKFSISRAFQNPPHKFNDSGYNRQSALTAIAVADYARQMKMKTIGLLVLAHTATDINQGSIPVLLPFLIAEHHVSYAAAATVVFAANIISMVAQPCFGYLSDRHSRPWLIPVAMLCAGIGISLTGVMPSFPLGVLVVALSGLGVAAFHPEGARLIHYLAEGRKATAMSFFAVGGQMGFAIGPLIGTAAMLLWGLKGSLFLVVPTALVAGLIIYSLPSFSGVAQSQVSSPLRRSTPGGKDAWGPFALLSATLLSRSVIFYGLSTFLPLFWIDDLHQSKASGGMALTILMAASIGGNLLGGRMADRFGYRKIALAGFVFLMILLPLFARVSDAGRGLLLLIPLGLALSLPTSPLVVLGQGYLPNRIGLASGVTLGLGFSFGGITVPLLGWIADHHGLHSTFWVLAFLPILCMGLTLALPGPGGRRQESRERSQEPDVSRQ
jgi:MFS transporter, FSR family, fosmidomycin resistance protein